LNNKLQTEYKILKKEWRNSTLFLLKTNKEKIFYYQNEKVSLPSFTKWIRKFY